MASDPRKPVLYLRPFEADGDVLAGSYFDFHSYEEYLARALAEVGPVVAVGSPRDDVRAPELGAARMYLRDDTWQSRVDELMYGTSLVVLHAGTSPGLRWEIQRAIAANMPEKLIICLPVDRAGTSRKRRTAGDRYTNFHRVNAHLFPRSLPPKQDGAAFCYFDVDWTPRLLILKQKLPMGTSPRDVALRALAKRLKRRIAPDLRK